MFRKFMVVGLVSVVSFVGFGASSEAGQRHRRAKQRDCQPCVGTPPSSCNSGCTNDATMGYGGQPLQNYGAYYNNTGMNGNYASYSNQGNVNGNVRGNILGNGMIRGR